MNIDFDTSLKAILLIFDNQIGLSPKTPCKYFCSPRGKIHKFCLQSFVICKKAFTGSLPKSQNSSMNDGLPF